MAEKDKKPDKQDKRKPYKFSPEKKEAYLLALGEGMLRGAAAESVGVHRETIRVHRNEDPTRAPRERAREALRRTVTTPGRECPGSVDTSKQR